MLCSHQMPSSVSVSILLAKTHIRSQFGTPKPTAKPRMQLVWMVNRDPVNKKKNQKLKLTSCRMTSSLYMQKPAGGRTTSFKKKRESGL